MSSEGERVRESIMPEYQSDPVIQRLDRLERENWYWKRATLLLFIVMGSAILMAVSSASVVDPLIRAQTIEAQKFVLKDSNGIIRAELKHDAQTRPDSGGMVSLEPYGKNKPTRAALYLQDGWVYFNLQATDKLKEAWAREEAELLKKMQSPEITLKEKSRLMNTISPQVSISTSADAGTALSLQSREGSVVSAFVGRNPTTRGRDMQELEIADGKGARAVLGSIDLETTATGSVEQRPASSLVLFNKDGKVIWQTP